MYYRSSSTVVTLRQFLKELCLFVNLEYGKCTVFRTFLLHALTYWAEILRMTLFWCAREQVRVSLLCVNFYTPVFRRDVLWYGDVRPSLRPSVRPTLRPSGLRPPIFRTFLLHTLTYWAEILHMTLFWCTTDQVRLSSLCVNFWRSYASLWTKNKGNVQFSALFSYMLWHIELKFCIWLCFTVLQIKFECRQFALMFVGVTPLLELRILKIHSFLHFSLSCFDILSSNFAYDFVWSYYRSSSSVVNFCGSYAPFGT